MSLVYRWRVETREFRAVREQYSQRRRLFDQLETRISVTEGGMRFVYRVKAL